MEAAKKLKSVEGVKLVLLDIEGTVCPISFVKDVLFPYALTTLPSVLETEWDSPTFTPYRDAFPAEYRTNPSTFASHVHSLMTADIKIWYLKSLQGYLWDRGYSSGSLRCTLFPDVLPALERWHAAGISTMIYSSGSVEAQKLLFEYTDSEPHGDLRYLVSGWFDTVNAGGKLERGSYEKILKMTGRGERKRAEECLFLSDNVGEVAAATEAGMRAFVVFREGNKPLSREEMEGNVVVWSLDEVEIGGV